MAECEICGRECRGEGRVSGIRSVYRAFVSCCHGKHEEKAKELLRKKERELLKEAQEVQVKKTKVVADAEARIMELGRRDICLDSPNDAKADKEP